MNRNNIPGIPTFIVDSFTDRPFKGNPAGVCLLDHAIAEDQMQAIAAELNLSETAFVLGGGHPERFSIRYFSPKMEIPLCGHATLASAKTLNDQLGLANIEFTTASDLQLPVKMFGDMIEMKFPVYDLDPAPANDQLLAALGIDSVLYSGFNRENRILMLEIADADQLRELQPDFVALQESENAINGVSVTAKANDEFDFHSRYFWPWSGSNEDPVTGGTHTFLGKYWSQRLGKTKLRSFQSSARTGQMDVELVKNDLLIRGQAVIVFAGKLKL